MVQWRHEHLQSPAGRRGARPAGHARRSDHLGGRRRAVGAPGPSVSQRQTAQEAWPAPAQRPHAGQRPDLAGAHRRPVCGVARPVWAQIDVARPFPGVGAARRVHGVFAQLWAVLLEAYDDLVGLDWQWQAADGCLVKVPLGKRVLTAQRKRPGATPPTAASAAPSVTS